MVYKRPCREDKIHLFYINNLNFITSCWNLKIRGLGNNQVSLFSIYASFVRCLFLNRVVPCLFMWKTLFNITHDRKEISKSFHRFTGLLSFMIFGFVILALWFYWFIVIYDFGFLPVYCHLWLLQDYIVPLWKKNDYLIWNWLTFKLGKFTLRANLNFNSTDLSNVKVPFLNNKRRLIELCQKGQVCP